MDNIKTDNVSTQEWIKLNVGGKIFETTRSTLLGASYFRSLLERWCDNDVVNSEIKIDRSYVLFEHVLSLLRNPDYPFPVEHLGELDFYAPERGFSRINYNREEINKENIEKEKLLEKLLERITLCYRYIKEKKGLCSNDDCTNPAPGQGKWGYCTDTNCSEEYPIPNSPGFGIPEPKYHRRVFYDGTIYRYEGDSDHEGMCWLYTDSNFPNEKNLKHHISADLVCRIGRRKKSVPST